MQSGKWDRKVRKSSSLLRMAAASDPNDQGVETMGTCPECHGTGKCTRCKGSGKEITVGGLGPNKKCDKCGGSGNCHKCSGSGKR